MIEPQPHNLLLLRACFSSDSQAGKTALREWESMTDVEAHNADGHALLPLINERSTSYGWTLRYQGRIAGVFRYWWARNTVSLQTLSSAVEALRKDAIECLVLGDAALALGVYSRQGLRPINRLEILVAPAKQQRAVIALSNTGWKPRRLIPLRRALILESLDFDNSEGQSITLRWYAADRRCWDGVDDALWQHSRIVFWAGQEFRVPAVPHVVALIAAHPARLWGEITPGLWWADLLSAAAHKDVDWDQAAAVALAYSHAEALNTLLASIHAQFPTLIPLFSQDVPPSLTWNMEKPAILDGQALQGWMAHFIRWQHIAARRPLYFFPLRTLRYIARWYNLPPR